MTKFPKSLSRTAPSGQFLPAGRRLAAPSWVMPGTMVENCRFLSGKVDEVGLLFMESQASLAYSGHDLPPALADHPLQYHLHLPVDLPWSKPDQAAVICMALLEKTAFLAEGAENSSGGSHGQPSCQAVLHPSPHFPEQPLLASRRLAAFAESLITLGGTPSALLVENVPDNDLLELIPVIREYGFRVCLDSGHILGFGQQDILGSGFLLEQTTMLHLNAPGTGEKTSWHLPLTVLDAAGRDLFRDLVHGTPNAATVMLELFAWEQIEASLPLVCEWLLPPL